MEYGYQDDAYELLTREEYPSFGYMIQNEATTIWERFELKKSGGMNSHNHPMYGAVGYSLYAYLAGIRLRDARHAVIWPRMPKKLLSAQASVETHMGDVTVRWVKQYGSVRLFVGIPAGMTATVHTPAGSEEMGSGFRQFSWKR
jgi:alpha-L-rhamnosidase